MSLAQEIKVIRQKALLTQVQFADKLNVSFTSVNRWEAGKALPNVTAMKNIKMFCSDENIDYAAIEVAWIESKVKKGRE